MERYFLACVRVMAMLVLGSLLLTCDKNEGGGWYSPCSSNEDCKEELECVDVEPRFGEDFCSKTCSSSAYCEDWFGPDASCDDYCFKYCDSNSDCPGDSVCRMANDCRIE